MEATNPFLRFYVSYFIILDLILQDDKIEFFFHRQLFRKVSKGNNWSH